MATLETSLGSSRDAASTRRLLPKFPSARPRTWIDGVSTPRGDPRGGGPVAGQARQDRSPCANPSPSGRRRARAGCPPSLRLAVCRVGGDGDLRRVGNGGTRRGGGDGL